MEISSYNTAASTASASTAATSSRGVISSDFETFLKMLTAQLNNQDPLAPMQSEEFAVQLATFSGVEQQVKTNDLLEALGAQMGVMGMAQLAGWVGMEARSAMPAHFDGTPVNVVLKPAPTADAAVLVVKDSTGAEVQRVSAPLAGGTLDWTGVRDNGTRIPDGNYTFTLESYSNGALAKSDPVEVYAPVIEARQDGGKTVLVMAGGIEVEADKVTSLRAPA